MGMLLSVASIACSIVALICFILIVVKMFQTGDSTLGIVCLVLLLCFGLGGLVAFIIGWVKVGKYNAMNIMIAWTIAIILSMILGGANGMIAPVNVQGVSQAPAIEAAESV